MTEKKKTGFALMTPERRRFVSWYGAKRLHLYGQPPKFDSESGRAAGKKGGRARADKYRSANE